MKNKRQSYLKRIFCSVLILPVLLLIQTSNVQTAEAVDYSENHKISRTSVEKVQVHQKTKGEAQKTHVISKKKLSHDKIVSLTNQFMDILVQDLNKHNKVVNFETKDALLNEFEKVTTREVASKYVDFYFTEKADGLYVVPTETPSWFQEKNDYDMIRKDGNVIQVVQQNKNDLYGGYTIKIEFTYDEKWKITNIIHK